MPSSKNHPVNRNVADQRPRYVHTQRGPLYLLLLALAAIAFAVAIVPLAPLRWVMLATGGSLVLLAATFHQMTVSGEAECLKVAFGPLPLIRKSIPYSEIAQVSRALTGVIFNWGAQYVPARGWTYSLWGTGGVVLKLVGGKSLRIGTDDPDGLATFLAAKITA